MLKHYEIPNLPLPLDLEDKAVLKQCNLANRQLAELTNYYINQRLVDLFVNHEKISS